MADLIQRIKLRRGTAAQWTAANPTLLAGEEGYETDTRKRKVGDGATAWTSLAYDPTGEGGGGGGASMPGLRYTFMYNGTDYVGADGQVASSTNYTAAHRTANGFDKTYRDYVSTSAGPDPGPAGLNIMINGDAWDGSA